MKYLIFVSIAAIMLSGCIRDSETQKLWHKADAFIVLEERYLSEDQISLLKNHLDSDLKYDGIGRFYVRQSIVERSIKAPMIILVTPFTVVIDGFSMLVRGMANGGSANSGTVHNGDGGKMVYEIIKALSHKW